MNRTFQKMRQSYVNARYCKVSYILRATVGWRLFLFRKWLGVEKLHILLLCCTVRYNAVRLYYYITVGVGMRYNVWIKLRHCRMCEHNILDDSDLMKYIAGHHMSRCYDCKRNPFLYNRFKKHKEKKV